MESINKTKKKWINKAKQKTHRYNVQIERKLRL
jgi:hypothetical protein